MIFIKCLHRNGARALTKREIVTADYNTNQSDTDELFEDHLTFWKVVDRSRFGGGYSTKQRKNIERCKKGMEHHFAKGK